jgi:hypothetical protein
MLPAELGIVRSLQGQRSSVRKSLAVPCLTVVTVFCALPHLVGLVAPTLAVLEAQVAAVVSVTAAFLVFVRLSRHPNRFGFLPVYALASAATLLSSISWVGIPFIDAVFILTGFASAIILLALLGMIVAVAIRTREGARSIENRGGA